MGMLTDLVTLLNAVAPTFPLTAAQNQATPFIVYQRIYSATNNVLEGNGTPPIDTTRLQIDCWGATYAEAQTTAAAVTAAMLGWAMQNVQLGQQDGYETDVKLYRVILEYSVAHYS